MAMDQLPSREEIRRLLERNNLHPELGRPEYRQWTSARSKTPEPPPSPGCPESLQRWERRLNSATFRMQPRGAKEAYVVERPVKTKGGWTFVPLNGRA